MTIHDAAQPRCPYRQADDPMTQTVAEVTCPACLAECAAATPIEPIIAVRTDFYRVPRPASFTPAEPSASTQEPLVTLPTGFRPSRSTIIGFEGLVFRIEPDGTIVNVPQREDDHG